MKTIAQMADQSKSKLTRKGGRMKANYDKAKTTMKAEYNNTPFNSDMKAAYAEGVDDATYTPPDPDTWARKWTNKVT